MICRASLEYVSKCETCLTLANMVIALLMVSVGFLMGVVVVLQTITIQSRGDFTARQRIVLATISTLFLVIASVVFVCGVQLANLTVNEM